MKKLALAMIVVAACGKADELAGVERCLAEVTDAAMTPSCAATVTAASKHPKLTGKARAVLQHWVQLEASMGNGDPRARAARDRQLEDVRTFAVPELRAIIADR
jgi:hypothetical protein